MWGRVATIAVVAAVGVCLSAGTILAQTCNDWQIVSGIPEDGDYIYGLEEGDGVWVAVGDDSYSTGAILTSADLSTWTVRTTLDREMKAVAYSGQRWVAVGLDGAIYVSEDAVTWTQQDGGSGPDLHGVGWGPYGFVAAAEGGQVLTSADGLSWTTTTVDGELDTLYGVGWDGLTYVVVGDGGSILTSPDLTVWEEQDSGTTVTLYGVAGNGSIWIAVGCCPKIRRSVDGGVTWTSSYPGFSTVRMYDVTWTGGRFYAVGEQGTVRSSVDGDDFWGWTDESPPSFSGNLLDVVWDGARIVTLGWEEYSSDSSGLLAECESARLEAEFTWSPTGPTEGEDVTFTEAAIGVPTGRVWDFNGAV
jgi:hypothetical protein